MVGRGLFQLFVIGKAEAFLVLRNRLLQHKQGAVRNNLFQFLGFFPGEARTTWREIMDKILQLADQEVQLPLAFPLREDGQMPYRQVLLPTRAIFTLVLETLFCTIIALSVHERKTLFLIETQKRDVSK